MGHPEGDSFVGVKIHIMLMLIAHNKVGLGTIWPSMKYVAMGSL